MSKIYPKLVCAKQVFSAFIKMTLEFEIIHKTKPDLLTLFRHIDESTDDFFRQIFAINFICFDFVFVISSLLSIQTHIKSFL